MKPTTKHTLKSAMKLLTPLLLGSLLSACASMSGLQTARVLKKGEAESSFGGGQYSSEAIETATGKTGAKLSAPFIEYTYRQGLTDKWDAGLKLTLIGTAVLDAKYSLYSGDKLAFAVGAGLGYLDIESSEKDASGSKTKSTIIDIILPLYASYDFTDQFALYLVPKYIQRNISGASSGSASLIGSSLGFKIGKDWGAYVEGSFFKDTKTDFKGTQANLAFFWKPKNTWF